MTIESHTMNYELVTTNSFMQNKPNFLNNQTNISRVMTKHYDNFHPLGRRKNKAKTNPIQTQSQKCQNERKFC